MTARKPSTVPNSLEILARSIIAAPDPEPKREPEWSIYPGLAKAIQRKARRAGLDKPRGGLARWHRTNHREDV